MLFWRLGAITWLFRWVFRDPKVDMRFLLFGAVIADLIDMPIGTVFLEDRYATGELWAHSLLLPSIYMSAVLVATRRGRQRRAFMAVGVAWLFHLLLDGMWTEPDVFLWPFFGWEITPGQSPYWPLAWERALNDPWRWVLEIIGLSYLIWLWFAQGLNIPARRKGTMETGRLPGFVGDNA
ncbi:MAG TPA: metal-dependent hydrolase [Acidimicrobiia bacterium]